MAGKPAKRFEEQVSTLLEARPSNPKLTSRETQRSVRNDDHGDFTVGIKDIDESIDVEDEIEEEGLKDEIDDAFLLFKIYICNKVVYFFNIRLHIS